MNNFSLCSSTDEEGVRRTVCDMTLLIFHLILSGMTFEGVDIDIAEHILNYNLKRFPNGTFPNRLKELR